MKEINAVKYFAGAALAVAISSAAVAEPTRGFSIEHGTIAEKGAVSVELADGVNGFGAGVRAGMEKFEVVVNSGQVGGAGTLTGTDAIVKVALPALQGLSELKHSWSAFGGLSMYDDEETSGGGTTGSKYFNLSVGVAFTAEVDALSFTVTPSLVIDETPPNGSNDTETYLNIGMGAYFDLGETSFGNFKPGAEVVVSTLEKTDTMLNLGVRWGINERVNVDLVPVQIGNRDTLSLPGQIRLNAAF